MRTLYVLVEPMCLKQALYLSSIDGLREAAKKNNIRLKIISDAKAIPRDDAHVAGVIISLSIRWTLSTAEALKHLNLKPILVGATVEFFDNSFSGPTIDRYDLISRQIDYLVSAGRKRIAFIGSEDNDINDNIRKQAFISAMKALNLSVQERDIFSDDDGSSSCIERFLKFSGEYDGAICVNDKVGVELIVSAGIAGVKIPYDLFVLGSGDFQISRASKPSLSTSTLDFYKLGLLAVDIYNVLCKNADIDRVQITLPCEILVRESTANFPYRPENKNNKLSVIDENKSDEDKSFGQYLLDIEMGLRNCEDIDLKMLSEVGKGSSIASIAEALFMSVGTVNYRLKKIYSYFNVDNKAQLEKLVNKYIPQVGKLVEGGKKQAINTNLSLN